MTIEIIEAEFTEDATGQTPAFWGCWLEVSQASEAYFLPATAPGTLLQADLQAHFDAKEAQLFSLAQAKGLDVDQIYSRSKRIARAVVLVMIDEINILRGLHSLAERTPTQARTAIKNKLKTF